MKDEGTQTRFEFASSVGTGEVSIPCDIGYKGIVIGGAYLIDNKFSEPDPCNDPKAIDDPALRAAAIAEQIERLKEARNRTLATYQRRFARFATLPVEAGFEAREIRDAEEMLIADKGFFEKQIIKEGVEKCGLSAESAVYHAHKKIVDKYHAMGNDKFLALAQVMEQMAVTYMQNLGTGSPSSIEDSPDECVPVLYSLPAGILPFFYTEDEEPRIHGAIARHGTSKDHGRIIAKSSGITVAQIDEKTKIKMGDTIIIDGPSGKVILNPSPATLEEYRTRSKALHEKDVELVRKSRETKIIKTRDDQKVKISANIGFSNEIGQAHSVGAASIGLIRTELPFITGGFLPGEEEWYEIFKVMAKKAVSMPWTLRVVDFEGDKKREDVDTERANTMIRDQIKAALRVKKENPDTKVHIMIPTVSTLDYFHGMKNFFQEQATELLGSDKTKWPKLGCMIENPAIISKLDDLGADFLSIGTNDLISHLLGFDRYSDDQASQYDPTDIAVIEAIEKTMIHESDDCPVSLCGDMASDPRHIGILMGLGLRQMSVGVHMVPFVKEVVSRIDTREAQQLVQDLKITKSRAARTLILNEFNEKIGVKTDGTIDLSWKPGGDTTPAPAPTKS